MARPDRALEAEVVSRAQGRCEYCRFPESASELPFHLDHIIAEKYGGPTISANLAQSTLVGAPHAQTRASRHYNPWEAE
jgi:hypothetical protein